MSDPPSQFSAGRSKRSFLEWVFIDVSTFFLLVLLPLISAMDVAVVPQKGGALHIFYAFALPIGFAAQAIAALGLLNGRRWGLVMLILAVPLSLGTAMGAMLILLFLALRRYCQFAVEAVRRRLAQRSSRP